MTQRTSVTRERAASASDAIWPGLPRRDSNICYPGSVRGALAGMCAMGLWLATACSVLYETRPSSTDGGQVADAQVGGADAPVAHFTISHPACEETAVVIDTRDSSAADGRSLVEFRWNLLAPDGRDLLAGQWTRGAPGAQIPLSAHVLDDSTYAAPTFNLGKFFGPNLVRMTIGTSGTNPTQIHSRKHFTVVAGDYYTVVITAAASVANAVIRIRAYGEGGTELGTPVVQALSTTPEVLSIPVQISTTSTSARLQIMSSWPESFWFDNLAVLSPVSGKNILGRREFTSFEVSEDDWVGVSGEGAAGVHFQLEPPITDWVEAGDYQITLQVVDSEGEASEPFSRLAVLCAPE